MAPPSTRAAPVNVTLENLAALECGVCGRPLSPPIFQCDVGHVLCSCCRDKLAAVGRCHACDAPIAGGYRRNHGMEKLVESIRVPCPNVGCAGKHAYYDHHRHLYTCLHGPCHCPAEACGFVASTADHKDHFTNIHKWPCWEIPASERDCYQIYLGDGFNALEVVQHA